MLKTKTAQLSESVGQLLASFGKAIFAIHDTYLDSLKRVNFEGNLNMADTSKENEVSVFHKFH